jgi:hypothetical protein
MFHNETQIFVSMEQALDINDRFLRVLDIACRDLSNIKENCAGDSVNTGMRGRVFVLREVPEGLR